MQLGKTRQYQEALQALLTLQQQLGTTSELRNLATFLLYSNQAEAPEKLFPWVGVDDPRDRDGIAAYEETWRQFIAGEDLDIS